MDKTLAVAPSGSAHGASADGVALVTGAAGFIGSHLVERLVDEGRPVRAVDCLTGYYSREQKQRNLLEVERLPGCEVTRDDLRTCDPAELLGGVDVVFHQAGQPGVRASWDRFEDYLTQNVLVTERLLAASLRAGVRRFVYASSSSIYGDASRHPTPEDTPPLPVSPYGATKLAAEHLCGVYARLGLSTVALRYFTVYGPRQRPDMAVHRLIEAALSGGRFSRYGDGAQARDLTYVADVVEANVLAGAATDLLPGSTLNIAGGTVTTLSRLIELVEELVGQPIEIERRPPQPGDVRETSGSTVLADQLLGWRPRVALEDGLADQIAWHASRKPLERPV